MSASSTRKCKYWLHDTTDSSVDVFSYRSEYGSDQVRLIDSRYAITIDSDIPATVEDVLAALPDYTQVIFSDEVIMKLAECLIIRDTEVFTGTKVDAYLKCIPKRISIHINVDGEITVVSDLYAPAVTINGVTAAPAGVVKDSSVSPIVRIVI